MTPYDFDRRIECGRCLSECNYSGLSSGQAIDAIRKMRSGDAGVIEYVLDHCVFCTNCNYFCPVDARPAAFMIALHREQQRRRKTVPASLRYMINGMEDQGWHHNFFTDLYTDHTKEEKAVMAQWREPKNCPDSDLLWCSCATRIFPGDIERSRVLSGLPKFGGPSDCCGLPAMRSGLFEAARRVADNLVDRLHQSRFKRLVVMCGSCQDMFSNLMPEYLDQNFPFEIISIYEYLDEQMQAGNLKIVRRVEDQKKTKPDDICMFHSCYGHSFGRAYLDAIDRLARAVGYECTELAHTGEKNICCGMGGIYQKGSLRDILKIRKFKKTDYRDAGKKNLLAYCYGCFFISHLFQRGTAHFLLEKVLWALGDDIDTPLNSILGRAMNVSTIKHMTGIAPSALR